MTRRVPCPRPGWSSLCLLALLLALGCTEKKGSPVGVGLIDPDRWGEGPIDTVLYAVQDTSFEEVTNEGAASDLYVGRSGQTAMRSLLIFDGLPEADSIIRATVRLKRSPSYSVSSFDIVAYPVTTEWDELEVTWEDAARDSAGNSIPWGQPGGDHDVVEAGRFTFSDAEGDTLYEMDLDSDLVKGWIDGSSANLGIILISSDEGSETALASLASRQSESGAGEPTLDLEYVTTDDPDTIQTAEVLVNRDVFIYDYQGTDVPANLLLGDVPAFRSLLRFDLSGFDSTWTVIRAEMDLHVRDSTRLHDDLTVDASAVNDSTWSGPDTDFDTAILASATVSPGDSTISLNLTLRVQLWVTGDYDNNGLVVRMGRLTDRFGYLELHGIDSPQSEWRPSMRITYHKPGEAPFDRVAGPRAARSAE